MLDAFEFMNEQFDPADHYNVGSFLYGVGLCVDKTYRGRAISTEILKARVPLLKTLGLTITSTIFSGICSQKAAISAGYEENVAVSFKVIQAKFRTMDFSHANATHCKIMSLKVG